MYYHLQKNCKLVKGAKRGAIYNLETGKVYSINQSAVNLLESCRNKPVEKLLDTRSKTNKTQVDFLDNLTAMNLGSFYIRNITDTEEAVLPDNEPRKLEFLWLELTSGCNNRCLHCYATSSPTEIHKDLVPHERWMALISEARQLGASAIQLIGGEPLLYPKWRELVIKAREEGYDFIEIFTNATLVDDDCINFFKENNVNVATTIYSDCAEIHDKVTLHKGSFEKTFTAIKKILEAEVPLRIASIIMKANENEAEKIVKLCTDLGVEANPPDVVRPTGRGDDKDLLPTAYTKPPIKPPFYCDENSFYNAQQCHSCLVGKIAITSEGEVIPCIFARNQICGNVLTNSLEEIINGHQLQTCWHTTKDEIEKCKDCEYRYACNDCRPLAQGSDPEKRWLACSAGCAYDPYTGIWEEEKESKNE